MKKLVCLAGLLLCVGGLTACNKQEDGTLATTASTSACFDCFEGTKTSSTIPDGEVANVKTVFTGVLQEDAKAGTGDTITLFIKEVTAVEDPEDIVKSFQNDGVILHPAADKASLDWKQGQQIKVTVAGLPIMTMSIPPQLPGNSVDQVELVAD